MIVLHKGEPESEVFAERHLLTSSARLPEFSHVCWIPDLGLFRAGSSHEGLAVFRRGPVWINWPVCVTDPGWKAPCRPQKPSEVWHLKRIIFHQDFTMNQHASQPSSVSPAFITNVFTANQRNGLKCVVCAHLYVYLYKCACPAEPRTWQQPYKGAGCNIEL